MKHSLHPEPPSGRTAAASARLANLMSNHSWSTASDPASHDAGAFGSRNLSTAPARSWLMIRAPFHARPTLSVHESG